MKRLALILTLGSLGLAACVDNESAVRLLGARPLTGEACTPEGDVEQTSGSLDVSGFTSAGRLPRYRIAFNLESNLEALNTTLNGEELAGPERNDIVFERVELSYASQPAANFESEVLRQHFVVRPGATDDSFIGLELIGPRGAARLRDLVTPGATYTLLVTVKLSGELASGRNQETNEVTFPIEVFNSGFAGCPEGQVRTLSGPCGTLGGQDGSAVACQAAAAPAP